MKFNLKKRRSWKIYQITTDVKFKKLGDQVKCIAKQDLFPYLMAVKGRLDILLVVLGCFKLKTANVMRNKLN